MGACGICNGTCVADITIAYVFGTIILRSGVLNTFTGLPLRAPTHICTSVLCVRAVRQGGSSQMLPSANIRGCGRRGIRFSTLSGEVVSCGGRYLKLRSVTVLGAVRSVQGVPRIVPGEQALCFGLGWLCAQQCM